MSTELVKEKPAAAFVPGKTEALSPQQQKIERNKAIEDLRAEKEKPRTNYMSGKGGKASDHFEVISNKDTVEELSDQTGAPKPFEDYTESQREKFLRDGILLPAEKAKKTEGAAAKKDGKEAEGNADENDKNLDKEIFQEIDARKDWWNEPEHAEAHKSMPERTVAAIQGLSAAEKNIIANSPTRTMQLDPSLDSFLGHALAGAKNLGRLHLELARDPGLLKRMNEDWVKTANNPKERWSTEQSIRYVLKVIDKRGAGGGSAANGAGAVDRKLTRAGKAPLEAGGGSSSPADDGSADAAWKRKDLSVEARGELYRERKNKEESEARRRRRR